MKKSIISYFLSLTMSMAVISQAFMPVMAIEKNDSNSVIVDYSKETSSDNIVNQEDEQVKLENSSSDVLIEKENENLESSAQNNLDDISSYNTLQEENIDSVVEKQTFENISESKDKDNNQDNVKQSENNIVQHLGGISVSINASMLISKPLLFNVVILKGDNIVYSEKAVLKNNENGEISSVTVNKTELPAGNYDVVVTALGFATYRQPVDVKDNVHSEIKLYTSEISGYDVTKATHPGFLRVGDANGDGVLNSSDVDAIVAAIDNKTTGLADLNHDGVVNLIDLEFLALNLAKEEQQVQDVVSTIQTRLSNNLAIPSVNKETKVENGSILDLVGNGGKVSFTTVSGKEISENNSISIDFDFTGKTSEIKPTELPKMEGMVIESPSENNNSIKTGTVSVVYVEGNIEKNIEVAIQDESPRANTYVRLLGEKPTVTRLQNGSLQVNFGKQVAVKKITLNITATQNKNLAEISKVEFLNNMDNRIPEPEMDIPEGLSVKEAGDKRFVLTWKPVQNVTVYEIEIIGPAKNGKVDEQMVVRTTTNTISISSINNKKLINGKDYTVRIQSVNGEWKSGWSESIIAKPVVTSKPDAPDNLETVGGYKSIEVSWKDMIDTDTYTVLYQRTDNDEPYKVAVSGLSQNSYKIEGLEDNIEYRVVVYGTNELGDSTYSIPSTSKTSSLLPAWMPSYKLINKPVEENQKTEHIVKVEKMRSAAQMVDSSLDTDNKSAFGVVDNNQGSYYYLNDWDDGVYYGGYNERGIKVTFDNTYKFGAMAFAEPENGVINQLKILYHDVKTDEIKTIDNLRYYAKIDKNNRRHIYVSFDKMIETDSIQLMTATGNTRTIKIAEIRFYEYDSIYTDIMSLYEDEYHTTLKSEVTEDTINKLDTRLNTKEENSGEYHPEKNILQREIDTARKILLNQSISNVKEVKASISAVANGRNDSSLGFTGLNDWQPLGVTIGAGESVAVYVGHPNKRVGDNTQLQVIFTQYNAESGKFMFQTNDLKIGENILTAPTIVSKDFERGGSVYIRYTGSDVNEKYGVRIDGGTAIPMLDLYKITDKQERINRVVEYIKELESYVGNIETLHNQLHKNSENVNINKEFKENECILGATELLTDRMLISVSAKQILVGLGNGSTEEKAEKLNNSMQAMDDMMTLFYQHKGLTDNAENAINKTPAQHLNIRYMRMFAGAFMYASGNHIGIGWNSIPGMSKGIPVVSDNKGAYQSGEYFGWGIGHEIGHNINQGSYAIAEVTNNYFAQLSTYNNGQTRFTYNNVYDKVTSNTIGRSENVFTQLAMYWQLRLAYDNYYPYKTFNTEKEVYDNLFFARVDTYARTPSRAPKAKENGVDLVLDGDVEQNFIRLASAAAQKNLTEFFTRWGWIPNEKTLKYIQQWEEETRKIYYVNDKAQEYRIENPNGAKFENRKVIDKSEIKLTKGTDSNGLAQNQVKIEIIPNSKKENLLGYEINRTIISAGEEQTQTVGFVLAGENENVSFTDTVSTINNRTFTYSIVPIDQYLTQAQSVVMDTIKIKHDGSHDKHNWTATTNMISSQDKEEIYDEQNPDAGYNHIENMPVKSAIGLVLDNKLETTYTGTTSDSDAIIELNFGKTLDVTGLKFNLEKAKGNIPSGTIEVQLFENGKWNTVKTNKNSITKQESSIIYFTRDDGWLRTSSAAAIRLIFKNTKTVSVSELDVIGPTGDNVELFTNGIGILKENYIYDKTLYETSKHKDGFIPANAVVFIGEYKGNPAYNAVMLFDQNGKMVGYNENGEGTAEQIILAEVPDKGDLANTSDGRWVYWIDNNAVKPKRVRVELYRVDDATTNEGQRLVSDSLWVEVPTELPQITINDSSKN